MNRLKNSAEDFRIFREALSDYFHKVGTGTLTRNIESDRLWRRLQKIANNVVYEGKFGNRMANHPKIVYSAEGYRIYKLMKAAECWNRSKARELFGDSIVLEHVYPKKAMVRAIHQIIESGGSNEDVESFLVQHYRLAIISKTEQRELDSTAEGKSAYVQDRLKGNGILVFSAEEVERPSF